LIDKWSAILMAKDRILDGSSHGSERQAGSLS
jgi:hypothetical protein